MMQTISAVVSVTKWWKKKSFFTKVVDYRYYFYSKDDFIPIFSWSIELGSLEIRTTVDLSKSAILDRIVIKKQRANVFHVVDV